MKTNIKNLLYLCLGVLILFITACSPSSGEIPDTGNSSTPTTTHRLAGTSWHLLSYGVPGAETTVLDEMDITLQFGSGGRIGGSGGCNSYGAQYEITAGNMLSISEIESTLMACTAAGVMNQEGQYFAALRSANSFELSGDRLTIQYDNGKKVLNFTGSSGETPTPSSTPTPAPTMTPYPSPTQEKVNSPERIIFPEGATSTTVTGHLAVSESKEYVLHARDGQMLNVDMRFTQGSAILAIWGADGQVLMSDHAGATRFQGVLPGTQDYHIFLRGSPESGTTYSMTVEIPPLASTYGPERIEFESGAPSAMVSGQLAPSSSKTYVVHAQDGQTMSVELSFTEGEAILVVWGADGDILLSDRGEVSDFQGELPATQDYFIEVYGWPDGEIKYQMTVTIRSLE